jgi:hypothetical protein
MKIALSLGADYVAGHYCKKRKLRCMAKQYINATAGADNNKINPTSFVNYHKNNWLNHYFLLGS